MKPDRERRVFPCPGEGALCRLGIHHQRCRRHDAALVRVDDAGDDARGEAEIVRGDDEPFHAAL